MEHTINVLRGSEQGKVQSGQITRSLSVSDALVEVTHASLCGTDDLYLHSPQVLGHEGIGIVKDVGSDVKNVKVGDRVGFGYIQKVCDECENCRSGWDQYCPNGKPYGKHDINVGLLASSVVYDAGSLIPVPPDLESSHAAALMCSGATAWTVLTQYRIRPGERVGILGIGGLGHMAIKLASAMGYHVVAMSRTESKKKDCLAFGANEFQSTTADDLHAMKKLDHLLICTSVSVDYKLIISLMATHGTIYPLTVDLAPSSVPILSLTDQGLRIQGSVSASRKQMRQTLEFAAERKIEPEITPFEWSAEGVEQAMKAMKAMEENTVRYKCVLTK
ncbi:hypothetical protein ASPWEDRAFT_736893 [Aspergillus wentii DTO 134E9]|uniref:Enoyl reductase (ER) domain-containing protein n=1 Tax=Aspergillus wentii DTO 134E9 TaxID=1073089 RepID=A0A1L9RYA0_ASPWE|nr:uncharacterized protein ASPWEDRAFT_736893 [Aspergillus wentii DTO 134E9]KAI9931393.1 hypothetical protein MW887_009968 [Aspergillus wentii]OJJ39940.1 hypothetical protein ASPWEDRAFT_736893 [Aspergillus wentii DTO 134E9]